jgi:hypothetical protein
VFELVPSDPSEAAAWLDLVEVAFDLLDATAPALRDAPQA